MPFFGIFPTVTTIIALFFVFVKSLLVNFGIFSKNIYNFLLSGILFTDLLFPLEEGKYRQYSEKSKRSDNDMIKGAQKQMIVVRTGNSPYFDEAYFVLRRDMPVKELFIKFYQEKTIVLAT